MARTEPRGGIAASDRLVWQVMTKGALPLSPARVLDRRQRLRPPRPEVHRPPPAPLGERPQPRPRQLAQPSRDLPSIIQRKVLDPNDFDDTAAFAGRSTTSST